MHALLSCIFKKFSGERWSVYSKPADKGTSTPLTMTPNRVYEAQTIRNEARYVDELSKLQDSMPADSLEEVEKLLTKVPFCVQKAFCLFWLMVLGALESFCSVDFFIC